MKAKLSFLILGLVSVIVFIIQSIFPNFTELFVLNGRAIYNLEIWRFFTAIFLHANVIHLIYNLFALLFFGVLLEHLVGTRRFLALFIVSGIIANFVSVWFYESSLGASGAIYGILGALIIIRPMMMVWAFGLVMPMFVAGIVWIVAGVIGIFIPSNTGHIAHLSGIGVGILFGLFLLMKGKRKLETRLKIPEEYMDYWENKFMK